MLRLYHLLLGSILVVSVPLGVKFVLPQFSPPKVVKSPTVVKLLNPKEENIWQNIWEPLLLQLTGKLQLVKEMHRCCVSPPKGNVWVLLRLMFTH